MTGQFNASVGVALRKARLGKGWTQAKLAAESGLSQNYVARLERGEMGASLLVATRLCRALGMSVRVLVSEAA